MNAPAMNDVTMIQSLVVAVLRQGSKPASDVVQFIAKKHSVRADIVRKEVRRLLERGEISVGTNLKLTISDRGTRTIVHSAG
jgi:hypothetical protein